jgi:cobalt-zinc-cadmium efflux system membrane fusion protein
MDNMTVSTSASLPAIAAVSPRSRRRWFTGFVVAALAVMAGGAAFHYGLPLLHRDTPEPPPPTPEPPAAPAVRVAGLRLVAVAPDTPLAQKLHLDTVRREAASAPVLTVTGTVAARLSPAPAPAEAHWDFASTDLAQAYGDWVGARADSEAAEMLLTKVKELVAAKIKNYRDIVERYEGLIASGAGAPKDYAQAKADLLQGEIQGATDIYSAEVTLRAAQRKRALVERQLLQLGVDPIVLARHGVGTAVVVADVPEGRVSAVRDGQACSARFVAYPGDEFPGKVGRLSPSVAKDSRTLRVMFDLDDQYGKLRPGLFADIGLGTEPRDALTVTADAVLHIGRRDYVLTAAGPDTWKVTEVRVVEPHNGRVEVTGLSAGTQVIGGGSILLKPLVVQALHAADAGVAP